MKSFLKKNNKLNRAFTLVETLIAISIFSISVLALMSVLGQGISNTNYAKQKILASYLAQEGVEYIRNMRDTYVLYSATSTLGWSAFNTKLNDASCGGVNGCYFDNRNVSFSDTTMPMTDLILSACLSSGCPQGILLYDSSTGKYNYVSGTNSGFTRKIQISQPDGNQTKISSTVSWTQGSGVYSTTFSESLFNCVQ